MLKRLAILGVLLALTVPAMAVQNHNSGNENATKPQRITPPASTVSNNEATTYYQQSSEDKPKGWHKLIAWPEGITAWAIMLTLGAITWQAIVGKQAARAAEKGAEAALRSALAVINAERAWILVKRVLPPKDLFPPSPQSATALEDEVINTLTSSANYVNADADTRARMMIIKREEIRLRNSALLAFWVLVIGFRFKVYGDTPAKIIEAAFVFRVVDGRQNGTRTEPDLKEPPEYGTPNKADDIPDMGSVLPPRFPFKTWVTLQNSKLSPEEVADIIEHKKFLCAYGFVRYRDAFEGTPRMETRFGYVYDVRIGGVYIDPETSKHLPPDGFRTGGPASYNHAT